MSTEQPLASTPFGAPNPFHLHDEPSAVASVPADWSLLRKFNTFWPSRATAPASFPWLAPLVGRRRAWRWESQYSKRFSDIQPGDDAAILQFIAETLTQVEPPGADAIHTKERDGRRCCKPRNGPGLGPLPPPPTEPGPYEICEEGFTEDFCGQECGPDVAGERRQMADCNWAVSCHGPCEGEASTEGPGHAP